MEQKIANPFVIKDSRVASEDERKAKEIADKYQKSIAIAAKLEASLKPKGYYNIPEILDERRLQYGIPNGAFDSFPAFDKVFVYQIALPGQGGEKWSEGGLLVKPEQTQHYERETAPRGIIVSAGLKALDSLRSTGFDIGHIVRFKKLSPFIMPVAEIDGKWLSVYVVRDGDIESSEDLATEYHARKVAIVNVSKTGYDHRVERDGVVGGAKVDEYTDTSM